MSIDFNTAPPQDTPRYNSKVDVKDIRERLSASAESFVRWLFSSAVVTKAVARIGSVQGEPGTSLKIELAGSNVGKWNDHATGKGGNDLIGLYCAYRGYSSKADFPLALNEIACDFLGDPIKFHRPSLRPTPQDQIEATKKTFADQHVDMVDLGAPVKIFHYYDASRNIIAKVCRYEPDGTRESKTFRTYSFEMIDGMPRWKGKMPNPRPLYHLPEIAQADTVILVEGEGKADTLAALGLVVTSAMGGANADEHTYWQDLSGKTVKIWPDNDKAGHDFASRVIVKLAQLGCTVMLVPIPSGKSEGWDCADCIDEGEDAKALLATAVQVAAGQAKPGTAPPGSKPTPTLILTDKEFMKGFTPPDYLVDGVIQKSYLYSLTARTGHGKTATVMLLGQAVARGVLFHGRPTEQGGVLFLAGENPQDIRARYIVLADHEGFEIGTIPFRFVDGVIDIRASLPRIRVEAANVPNLVLVIVDTAAAYYTGTEGNENVQQGDFARLLRELIKLPGNPAVITNCHPVKNATQDNLVPMGGSAFLNEVDGNLTLWAEDRVCTLAPHAEKWRGVQFESMAFDLRTIHSDNLKDAKGRKMPSVIAIPITEAGAERKAQVAEDDEDVVLRLIHADKHASFATIAKRAGFTLPDGSPAKAKVQRIIERLKANKLIYKYRGSKYRLTKKGCKAVGLKWEKGADDDE